MKTSVLKIVLFSLLVCITPSCMTTYDAQGNPVQSVDPAAATAAAVAAGAVGYAIANDRNKNYYYSNRHYHHHHHRGRRGGRR